MHAQPTHATKATSHAATNKASMKQRTYLQLQCSRSCGLARPGLRVCERHLVGSNRSSLSAKCTGTQSLSTTGTVARNHVAVVQCVMLPGPIYLGVDRQIRRQSPPRYSDNRPNIHAHSTFCADPTPTTTSTHGVHRTLAEATNLKRNSNK